MKKSVLALATAATIGVTALMAPSPAQAWRGGWGWGGLAGGLVAGAVIGGIASSAYAYGPGYGYYGGPGYGYGGYAPAYGYGGYDDCILGLEFLRFFPRLRHLCIDAPALIDLSGLQYLQDDLQTLRLGATKSNRFSLRFLERFCQLHTLSIEGPQAHVAPASVLEQK